MHTIDLLKGQGVPAKTTFGGIVIIAVAVIVPFLVAAGMLDWYLLSKSDIDLKQRQITKYRDRIAEYSPDVELNNVLQSRRALLAQSLSEVSRCVDTFVQWSPILLTVAENMPGELIMNRLEAQSQAVRLTAPKEEDADKPVEIPVPERAVVLDVSGKGADNYDKIAWSYRDGLESSSALSEKLDRVDFSRVPGTIAGEQAVSYSMSFIFRTESK